MKKAICKILLFATLVGGTSLTYVQAEASEKESVNISVGQFIDEVLENNEFYIRDDFESISLKSEKKWYNKWWNSDWNFKLPKGKVNITINGKNIFDSVEVETLEESIEFSKEYSIDSINKIDLKIAAGKLNLMYTDSDKIKLLVKHNLTEEFAPTIESDSNDGTLSIESEKKVPNGFWISDEVELEFNLYIPKDYEDELLVEMISGNISSEETLSGSEITLRTTAGNIDIEGLEYKEIIVDSTSGNIELDEVKAEKTTVDLTAGNIEIQGSVGELEINATAGSVELDLDEITDDMDIEVTSGSIEMDLPKVIDAEFTIKAFNFGIDVPKEMKISKDERRLVVGKIGSGKYDIRIKTMSGNVDLD